MSRIIIDVFPATGHFNSTFRAARILQDEGYRITYTGPQEYESLVADAGFNYVVFPYFLIPQLFSTRGYWNISEGLFSRLGNRRINEARIRFDSFRNFMGKVNPDLVLLDEHFSPKALIYMALNIRIAFIQTMPDPVRRPDSPPFTSYFVPANTLISRIWCNLLWIVKNTIHRLHNLKRKIIYLNQDLQSIYEKVAFEKNKAMPALRKSDRSFGPGLENIPRIILSPAALEFDTNNYKSNCYSIGPLIDTDCNGITGSSRFSALLRKIIFHKNVLNGYIIYCSFGTQTLRKTRVITRFFGDLVSIAKQNPEDLFVLSTGDHIETDKLLARCPNLFVFKSIPQQDLLQFTDMMISHGGLNSITECIFNEVPMVIYPLSGKWDQPGNSARILYHGLGLRGRLKYSNKKNISGKIRHLKTHYLTYKRNISRMKLKFAENNCSTKLIRIVSHIINTPGYDKKTTIKSN